MTQNNLVGKTTLVVEDQFTNFLDLKDVLEEADARVLLGSQHVDHAQLSAAVLDRAESMVADRLTAGITVSDSLRMYARVVLASP